MRRHGAKQGDRMDYRMARHAAARHTGMRSVRRIAAAALGLALSLAGSARNRWLLAMTIRPIRQPLT